MEDTNAMQESVNIDSLVKTDKPIITEPEIIIIYDTRTGEPSKFRIYTRDSMMRKLAQKRADGSLVFTTIRPSVIPARGNLKCLLHAKDPNRKHYDELGLPMCPKDNITSPYQVKRHMQKKHPMEWETIEAERLEKERLEEKELRSTLIKSVAESQKPKVGRPPKEK